MFLIKNGVIVKFQVGESSGIIMYFGSYKWYGLASSSLDPKEVLLYINNVFKNFFTSIGCFFVLYMEFMWSETSFFRLTIVIYSHTAPFSDAWSMGEMLWQLIHEY